MNSQQNFWLVSWFLHWRVEDNFGKENSFFQNQKSIFLTGIFIEEFLVRMDDKTNLLLFCFFVAGLHRHLQKCVQRHIGIEFWTFSPQKCNGTYGGPPGLRGVRKFSKFPRTCRRGPSWWPTTLQSPRLFYSSKNMESDPRFWLFQNNYPLELVGGDRSGVQLLLQIRGFD